ncbi:hypothetical protein EV421DRAFT_1822364, partial [Armillaria borealis]
YTGNSVQNEIVKLSPLPKVKPQQKRREDPKPEKSRQEKAKEHHVSQPMSDQLLFPDQKPVRSRILAKQLKHSRLDVLQFCSELTKKSFSLLIVFGLGYFVFGVLHGQGKLIRYDDFHFVLEDFDVVDNSFVFSALCGVHRLGESSHLLSEFRHSFDVEER